MILRERLLFARSSDLAGAGRGRSSGMVITASRGDRYQGGRAPSRIALLPTMT